MMKINCLCLLFFQGKVLVIDMETFTSSSSSLSTSTSSSSSSISLNPHAFPDTHTLPKVPVPQGFGAQGFGPQGFGAPYLTAPWGQKILSTVYQSYVG